MGKNKRNIKIPEIKSGKKITAPKQLLISDIEHPIFCFRYLHRDYGIEQCTSDEKISLLTRLHQLSSMSWEQIRLASRHGLGTEKIAKTSIRPGIPPISTNDVDFLLALRFHGNAPFVGHKNNFIFHILYIDRAFNVYPHGN